MVALPADSPLETALERTLLLLATLRAPPRRRTGASAAPHLIAASASMAASSWPLPVAKPESEDEMEPRNALPPVDSACADWEVREPPVERPVTPPDNDAAGVKLWRVFNK